MIFLLNANGGFGNRAILIAHTLASAIESQQSVVMPFVSDLKDIVELNVSIDGAKVYIIGSNWRKKFKKIHTLITVLFRESTREYRNNMFLKKKGIHIIGSWYYRDYVSLFNHREDVLQFLKFNESITALSKKFYDHNTENDSLSLAVHIRRGDYQSYRNGDYYYSDELYLSFVKSILHKTSKKITFFFFSNEMINIEKFRGLGSKCINVSEKNNGIGFELSVMSNCDYIMGPPSTFSWWAAFYGNKKYLTLYKDKIDICLDDFKNVQGEEFNVEDDFEMLKKENKA